MLQTLGGGVVLVFSFLLLAQFVAFATWFLPPALAMFVAVRLKTPFRTFMPVMGVGLTLTAFWANFLLTYGAHLPGPIQWLLAIPLLPREGVPAAGRFDPGPWSAADLIGYTYLASVTGALLLLYSASLEVTARISGSPAIRIWTFRLAVLLVTAGGTWLLWRLNTGFHVLFGFVAYFFALGVLTTKTDPADELRE